MVARRVCLVGVGGSDALTLKLKLCPEPPMKSSVRVAIVGLSASPGEKRPTPADVWRVLPMEPPAELESRFQIGDQLHIKLFPELNDPLALPQAGGISLRPSRGGSPPNCCPRN